MTIEERLENMEREMGRVRRRNRWLLGTILVVVGGLIVPAVLETTAFRARAQVAGTAKQIRANDFVLEDQNGETRAILGVGKYGPSLTLYDENGKARAELGMFKNGPSLNLYDEKCNPRGMLAMIKDRPGLLLFDENRNLRFAAGKAEIETPDGKTIAYPESSLILFGPDGKVIWSAIK